MAACCNNIKQNTNNTHIIVINCWSRNYCVYTRTHTTGKHCIETVSSCTNELKMQVQTRLTTGERVVVLNKCYAPEKYERAMTLHRDNRLDMFF